MPVSIKIFEEPATTNFTKVTLGKLDIWFSYQTPIAFLEGQKVTAIDASALTRTTQRHVNIVEPDFNSRVPQTEFHLRLQAAIVAACKEIR
jgi:hypothetical protein